MRCIEGESCGASEKPNLTLPFRARASSQELVHSTIQVRRRNDQQPLSSESVICAARLSRSRERLRFRFAPLLFLSSLLSLSADGHKLEQRTPLSKRDRELHHPFPLPLPPLSLEPIPRASSSSSFRSPPRYRHRRPIPLVPEPEQRTRRPLPILERERLARSHGLVLRRRPRDERLAPVSGRGRTGGALWAP